MKIAVTGGGGFIGRATLMAAEKAGHEAWMFDRSEGHDIMGRLQALEGADAVIHLAGMLGTHELFDDSENAVQVNVLGALRVMNWCVDNRAIYVGIIMPDVFPSIYTATKIAAHRLSQALCHSRGLHSAHVRAFNAYGPGQKHGPGHPQKILPTFAVHAWKRERLPIWGSGKQSVDMIHVDDLGRMLVDAIMHASPRNPTFDGGTGVAMSVTEVAQLACNVAGWAPEKPDPLDTMPRDPRFNYMPMRRGEEEQMGLKASGEGWRWLGWRPRFDKDLMADAIRSYRPTVAEIAQRVVDTNGEILKRLA